MEKRLRLFHFSRESDNVNVVSGKIFESSSIDFKEEFDKIIDDLDTRVQKCMDDKFAKNFRFNRRTSQMVTNISEIFVSHNKFKSNSDDIASKFKDAIGNQFHNDFYLVVLTTMLNDSEVLFIVKMETGTAIQVTDENTLKTLDRILPDKKSRLQKATVIFKDRTISFKEGTEPSNSERENIHSRVLDRTDDNISRYFFKTFLESTNVIDDPDSAAKAAIEAIEIVSKPYLKSDNSSNDVKERLQSFLSQKRETSFDGLIGEISTLLDFEKAGTYMDSEKLAQEAYQNAKKRNGTVIFTFTAELKTPPRTVYVSKDNNKELEIRVFDSLLEQGDVVWEVEGNYSILKINTDRITILKR